MNNKDEVEYLNKARARAEYLATAKKRLETALVDELLMLVRKGSGEIAMLAGEEITNRIERRLTKRGADSPKAGEKCSFDPSALTDVALGMFHCPQCGEMVVAGMPHPDYSLID